VPPSSSPAKCNREGIDRSRPFSMKIPKAKNTLYAGTEEVVALFFSCALFSMKAIFICCMQEEEGGACHYR